MYLDRYFICYVYLVTVWFLILRQKFPNVFSFSYVLCRFRARGPSIHRRMDLSQYPLCPTGTPDDPLGDPCDDPSYDFSFKTSEYERTEDADSSGRVRGINNVNYQFLIFDILRNLY